jgi:arylsulfatase
MHRKPVFRYTFFDIADVTIPGTTEFPEGKVTLKTEFTPDGLKAGGVTLSIGADTISAIACCTTPA